MSHLLVISVGPVQEFIAAARRTRDLWFGSYLLSEISKAVAKSIKPKATLIFPNPGTNLEPDHPEINVANIILAELPTGEPKDVAVAAKIAAQQHWRDFAKDVQREVSGVIRPDIWADQVNDVIEFYAAWVARSGDYGADRAKLMRLLAGRKNCRDFMQASQLDAGLPKSSLDGQRATVFQGPKEGEKAATYRNKWPKVIRRKLRVRSGEQLDVVGVVKRIGEGNKPYPSVSRIAADVWIRGLIKRGGADVVKRFAEHCGSLPSDTVHQLRGFSQFNDFPFEGTTLFRPRHHEWWEETDDAPEQQKKPEPPEWYGEFDRQLKLVEEFAARHGVGKEPNPYLAVLVADGDKMGAAISNLASIEENQGFSGDLAEFAGHAKTIVEAQKGVLVYAGGDDVLAFLPVDKCLKCARELRNKFVEMLRDYKNKPGESPTLSVGVAIGHFMENLEDLLDYGRAAEKAAKKVEGKDALAVHLHKRGGAPISVRAKWSEKPDERLVKFAELMNTGIIPTKLPYELRAMAKVYESWKVDAEAAIELDLIRLIAKKQSRGVETVRNAMSGYLEKMNAQKLLAFAEELLVARQIATALKQAGEVAS